MLTAFLNAIDIGNMNQPPAYVNVPPLFVAGVDATDAAYINLRAATDGQARVARDFVEALWVRYHNDADANFETGIRQTFAQRFWEMALTCALRDRGLRVTCPKPGPDNLVVLNQRRVWIEAVCPTPGAPAYGDRVPDQEFNASNMHEVPERQLILRLRGAIRNKYHDQRPKYMDGGLIAADDSYVVAVNGCQLPSAIADTDPPRIVKAVLPIGPPQDVIDRATCKLVESSYAYRRSVTKTNKEEVATDIFLDPAYSGLSAVIYSRLDAGNPPHVLGDDFVLVHNPCATNPLPEGFLKVGREFRAEVHENHFSLRKTRW
jgi:hypothetical protein